MKKLRFIGLLVLLLMILSVPKSFAQTEKIINYEIDIYLTSTIEDENGKVSKDTVFTLNSGIENIKITPIGNYIRKVQFKIDPENPIMEYANPVVFLSVTMRENVYGDEMEEVMTDKLAILTSNGSLTLLYHFKPNKHKDK
ncbi:hypothetical protein [Maribellus mangrovi]|uniref:hypothetical protein n=1 Tax=Maribellus mangrovi TaxID=3133146 RepID=UPI0030ECCEBD